MMRYTPLWPAAAFALLGTAAPWALAGESEEPLGAAVVVIETTDNDIELQVFVDGSPSWQRLQIDDPRDRKLYDWKTRRVARRQGMSELFFASSPDHFPEDETGEIDPTRVIAAIESFLRKFPEGAYEMEAELAEGALVGDGVLTHVIPALPEIVAPLSDDEEPAVVDPDNLVIEWLPVTERFVGNGPVDIIEYQVILDQVDPLRAQPWVDGETRRALINLPGAVTRLTVPPEFLTPASAYEFEVLAIEASGNATISVGEFVTE